jgi:hypothetical protein
LLRLAEQARAARSGDLPRAVAAYYELETDDGESATEVDHAWLRNVVDGPTTVAVATTLRSGILYFALLRTSGQASVGAHVQDSSPIFHRNVMVQMVEAGEATRSARGVRRSHR